jgi:hypothetical protein
MHTVIVNGKQRVVNDEQLRLIKIVYRNEIEYIEDIKPKVIEEKTVEAEPKKVKSKNKKVEDEFAS